MKKFLSKDFMRFKFWVLLPIVLAIGHHLFSNHSFKSDITIPPFLKNRIESYDAYDLVFIADGYHGKRTIKGTSSKSFIWALCNQVATFRCLDSIRGKFDALFQIKG